MSDTNVLVTGGAGFIGTHACRELVAAGRNVRVIDKLEPQVHGNAEATRARARLEDQGVDFMHGDVGDEKTLDQALDSIDQVLHLASQVGVGQSMYEPSRYVRDNTLATATFLSRAIEAGVQRIVTASSMSIYGEGLYLNENGQPFTAQRDAAATRAGHWDPTDDGRPLTPTTTPETKRPDLASVYALTKYDQERLTLMMGSAYGVPTLALRFFNTYGPGQALQNPYTGVLAIFAARLLNDQAPLVYEDGHQLRDFIHVRDVARACRLALDAPVRDAAINVGTGTPRSVLDVAHALADTLDKDIQPEVLHQLRTGDVRHCYADTTRARDALGFQAEIDFSTGIADLAEWLADQRPEDRAPAAARELSARGLLH